jgi:3-oxoacyl-[acyl-carrier protein] reductase
VTAAPACPPAHGLLQGKTVLVTAAAGTGIGFATAKRCAEEGAKLVLSDVHEKRLGQAADEIERALGTRPRVIACDVTVEDQVQRMIDFAAEGSGLDVLVNNAGLGGTAPIVEMSDAQWSRVLDVTLTGTFRCTRAAMRHMMARGRGAIVNNASVLGWRAQAGQAHYAAAKAGVMALTRCAAIEAAKSNVRIKVTTEETLRELTSREAFGRAAEPWEIANVIVFLASDYATYMTGENVSVSSQHP